MAGHGSTKRGSIQQHAGTAVWTLERTGPSLVVRGTGAVSRPFASRLAGRQLRGRRARVSRRRAARPAPDSPRGAAIERRARPVRPRIHLFELGVGQDEGGWSKERVNGGRVLERAPPSWSSSSSLALLLPDDDSPSRTVSTLPPPPRPASQHVQALSRPTARLALLCLLPGAPPVRCLRLAAVWCLDAADFGAEPARPTSARSTSCVGHWLACAACMLSTDLP